MREFLGLTYLEWAFVIWGAIAATFALLLLFRKLTGHSPAHEAFMSPAEIGRTLEHLRNVDRTVTGFGIATAATLVLIGIGRALGLL